MIYVKTSGKIFKQLCQWKGTKSWVNAFLMLYKRENGEEEPQVKYKMSKINKDKARRFVLKLGDIYSKRIHVTIFLFYAILWSYHPVPDLTPSWSVPRNQEGWGSPPSLIASSWLSCQVLWKWVKAFIVPLFLFNDMLKDLTQNRNDWSACYFSL